MRPAAVLIAVAVLALGALSRCAESDDSENASTPTGSAATEEARVLAAVEAYVAALRATDPEAVCSLLTQAELDDLEVSGTCQDVFTEGFELLEKEQIEVPAYEISDVAVDGVHAQAMLASDATNEVVPLTKEDGEWKLAGATSLDQFHPDDPLGDGSEAGDGRLAHP